MLVQQSPSIHILATTGSNVEASRNAARMAGTVVVGNPPAVESMGLDMTHSRNPAQVMALLKSGTAGISRVLVFSDQIASIPVGQIYIRSEKGIASVSSFEMLCAMALGAEIFIDAGKSYSITREGGGQKEFVAALSEFLAAEEAKPGSFARALADRRLRRNQLLHQIHRVRQHTSMVMEEIYLRRLDTGEGQGIVEKLKEIERCARKELLDRITS